MAEPFTIKIWGARGTLSSLSRRTDNFGGNTACVEVRCGRDILILDAGSGLQLLGDDLMRRLKHASQDDAKSLLNLNLFFSHCHYDHISGFPFFAPFFHPSAKVNVWSGHLEGPDKTRNMIADYMRPPFFPVGPEVFAAELSLRDFEPEDVLRPIDGIEISTLSLNHHDGCVGYRIDFDERSLCYITDTTHIVGEPDLRIPDFCRDTDLMIYDGTYTDAEFPTFWNFGHSTWEEGVRLAKLANAKRYMIFHHRPSRDDKALAAIERDCRKEFRRSWAAREGQVIKL
ncbi:MAG: MBL fold metallo-hydrolase [Ahrensia sp.]|nr:MBL fold metallo-hydrolase [Ahrensia sp.]